MKKILAILLVFSMLVLSGCAVTTNNFGDGTVIAVSFYPVYIFTLNLVDGIENVNVQCMAEQNTGCLHDYTLTARDVRLLSDAKVFVINGAGMETFLEDLHETVDELTVIDSSEGIELLCGDSHEHEEETGHSHNHENNSHIWMSVENAKKQVVNIKDGLVESFPQYKDAIAANCLSYLERLNVLSDETATVSKLIKNENVISFHGAFEYLAEDAGFSIIDTVESDEGNEPSAKELAYLCNKVESFGVKAIFTEPDYSGSAAQVISNETGVEIYTLNPVISGENVLTSYEDIMRRNIEVIKKAVS